jgi:hypothetical protein
MDLFLLYHKLCMRGGLEVSTWLFQIRWIWYVSTNSSRSIFWIQKIFCSMMRWRSYVGMPVSTYDTSAMCQDLNLFLPEAFERSGGACLSPSYTSDWLFRELRHLAILSNIIKPWPMTKTGKVTGVVAVLHLYGNAKSSSINANAKISAKKTKLESKLKKLGLN